MQQHYHIWTIGCQMNKAESERLGSLFEEHGYRSTATVEKADIVVLNSCVVRQSAESRIVNKLHLLKPLKEANPGITVAVTGCLVNSNISQLRKQFPHIDHFFKPGEQPDWLGKPEQTPTLPQHPPPNVYVTIVQGCNNYCSYCIVPYRRGHETSRPANEIISEVRELVNRGAREITLLGQNVDSYGKDLPEKPDLADLLMQLNGTEGLARLRFLTNHPKDMSKKLIDTIAHLDKVCRQMNLPVQSGNNDILQAMKRGYTVEHYRRLIAGIREKIPGVALGTDVIVGFPSESEAQFQNTLDLLAELRLDTVHVASYSPRPGTVAARELKDNIPVAEKKRRLHRIEQLQEGIATEINSRLLGETIEILVEGRNKGKWQGRTGSDKMVFFSNDANHRGQLVNIRVDKTSPWSLQGKIEIKKTD